MVTTRVADWVPVIRREYLLDFIRNGGAAVKFAVPQSEVVCSEIMDALGKEAREAGYLFVALDAAHTRLHMIDQIFHAVAKQVDWDALAKRFLRSTLSEKHYIIPDEYDGCSLDKVAALNSMDLGEMRQSVNQLLRDRLYHDYAMTQEFRIAMLRLCLAQLEPNEAAMGTARAVKEWLRGELRLVSSLKSALIFQKVGRSNARNMLFSLAHWLYLMGDAGLALVLDITRFMALRRPTEPDGTFYYSIAAVLDGYEVLRQFVDDTDEMEHCFILVVGSPASLEPQEDNPRSVTAYQALWTRVADEVRDRYRVNPLASLIRVSDCQADTAKGPGGG
ncbi:MAG: DUF2791 family P-loop domain-containing protein [Chloroflexi bacterium]|nr:DUF2791 family P-loop domain-containing protein [Chloroflexota bacterium]